jgi:hypothetical protein
MKTRFVVAVVFLALVFVGCSRRMIDFTIISSKNVDINTEARGAMTEGSDWSHWLLFIPINLNLYPSLEEAIDRAIEAGGPEYDALMDGVLYWKNYWALLFFGNGFRVRGIPVNTTKQLAKNPDIVNRIVAHSSIRDQFREVSEKNLNKLLLTHSFGEGHHIY